MSDSDWTLVYSRQAQQDARKLASSGLKAKAQLLLDVLAHDPFGTPPRYENLVGDLAGCYSRRINIQHRLVYEVLPEHVVHVHADVDTPDSVSKAEGPAVSRRSDATRGDGSRRNDAGCADHPGAGWATSGQLAHLEAFFSEHRQRVRFHLLDESCGLAPEWVASRAGGCGMCCRRQ